jgi:hypothetical protein
VVAAGVGLHSIRQHGESLHALGPAGVPDAEPEMERASPVLAVPRSSPDLDVLDRAWMLNLRILQDPRPENHADEARAFLAEWAEVAPEAAFQFAAGSLENPQISPLFLMYADEAIRKWVEKDAGAAMAFLERHGTDRIVVDHLAGATIRALAGEDVEKAVSWVRDEMRSDSDFLRPVLGRELVMILEEMKLRDMTEIWLSDRGAALQAYALDATVCYTEVLAKENPQKAMRFAEKLPRGTLSRHLAIQHTVQMWTRINADEAYDWIAAVTPIEDTMTAALPSGEENEVSLPDGAYTSAELDYAIAGYALAVSVEDRGDAMQSARAIRDESLRRRIMDQIVSDPSI